VIRARKEHVARLDAPALSAGGRSPLARWAQAFAAPRGGAAFVVVTWAASRVLFMTAGSLGARFLLHAGATGSLPDPPGYLNIWAHWDGGWYSAIASHGYAGTLWPASTNFFPLYPVLLRIGSSIAGEPPVGGVAISLVASLFALYFLHELAADLYGERVARLSTIALAFFPTAFVLNAVYTESLFLAFSIGSVWAARVRSNFVLAGVLGCLAAGTRNVGIFLVIPLVHEWIRQRKEHGRLGLAAIGFVPLGLLAYMFWLWRWSSHPLLFATVVKQVWGRKLTDPVTTVDRAITAAISGAGAAVHPGRVFSTMNPNASWDATNTFNLGFLVLLVVLVVAAIVLLPRGLALYAAVTSVEPVLTPAYVAPLASLPRYFLAAFPLFLVIGIALSRSRALLGAWLLASGSLGVLLTLYFTTWRWVA
jgi:hypothetical protein